ncbi:MAG: phosphoribosylaminoimidazolesuccinocarboxamide synthase [Bacteroidota bacterium]|nr:phosphoribosylaminoimidazolesuccinocarboxamide synthase [Bacteroidota bacterium]
MAANTLMHTDFVFAGQTNKYTGKVREVYTLADDTLIMIATDRLSAFDVVMPRGIPFKGQILNQIATQMMKSTADLVPNWILSTPDPNVAVGKKCTPFKIEMVIRGYLSGHAAREYKAGKRLLCGVAMPEGMEENDAFPKPIITPATKAKQGDHDEDISEEQILEKGIVSEQDYNQLKDYTNKLFSRGTDLAAKQGLLLVDTKYEFGKDTDGNIVLIDEIHTPDSSRYFYADGYEDRQKLDEPQKQLSKEFVRQWLIRNGFQGLSGQQLPLMGDDYIDSVSKRYVELYEQIMGVPFEKASTDNIDERMRHNLKAYF